MPTKFQHRLHLIVPADKCDEVNAYIKANIDRSGGDWLTPSLSADGKEPFTHAQFSAAVTPEQLTHLQKIVASVSKVSEDANFDKLTAANKEKWFADNAVAAKAEGIKPVAMDNTKEFVDPQAALVEMDLKTASSVLGE